MMKNRSYGIMQGRLTPSKGRGIQFFPFENWEQEFYICKELKLDEIEWIFDYERYTENPLWNEKGVSKIRNVIEKTGISVHSVCLDYFMRRPFYKKTDKSECESIKDENISIISNLLKNMKSIGARLIEIPMVDDSSVKNDSEERNALNFLQNVCDIAVDLDILVGVESDYPPERFFRFIDDIGRSNARSNYDSGNSSGLGYDHEKEILNLDHRLQNLHIKDRVLGNGTVMLGTGSADFVKVFRSLKSINYEGSIILQAARGEDGAERENIASQLTFVKKYVEKYDL